MKFGIIGTNWITDRFLKAAAQHPSFTLSAVYSRKEETGRAFAEKYGVDSVYTDLAEMFSSGDIEAVYVASPNSLHAEQSVLAMEHGIHVLCEKPAVTTVEEMDRIIEASQKHNTTFMEAMKSTVTPSFLNMKEQLGKIGPIRRFFFHYNQYSSRYDNYKQGIIENSFKPELGNGARMDLGVYGIAPVVHLAGAPESFLRNDYPLSTGADGQGSMILNYSDKEAVVTYSKISDSALPSEIQGEDGTIEIDRISDPKKITLNYRDGRTEDLSVPHEFDTMYYELAEFIRCAENGEIESPVNTHAISRETVRLLME